MNAEAEGVDGSHQKFFVFGELLASLACKCSWGMVVSSGKLEDTGF